MELSTAGGKSEHCNTSGSFVINGVIFQNLGERLAKLGTCATNNLATWEKGFCQWATKTCEDKSANLRL